MRKPIVRFALLVGCLVPLAWAGTAKFLAAAEDPPKPDAASSKNQSDSDEGLANLAKAVLSAGKQVPIMPGLAKYFGMPTDTVNTTMKQVVVRGSGESARLIWVHRRVGTDRVDMLMVSKVAPREFYYLTSPAGVLEKTALKAEQKDPPRDMSEEEAQGFDEEVAFWKDWLSKRDKSLIRKKPSFKGPTTRPPKT